MKSIELFAGAGGLALGLERSGFHAKLLNEIDENACATLRHNRPNWPVLNEDIRQVDFSAYKGQIDLLAGGFPCQAFSSAGKGKGFEDARGSLFFEFARAIDEVQPKVILGENVRGLLAHDQGRTLAKIKQAIDDLGYQLVPPVVLKAINYNVPQKRERLFLMAIRKDIAHQAFFSWPKPSNEILTLRDALKKGRLYDSDVPFSEGQIYAPRKKAILDFVPQGGYWRDLPDDLQRAYMKNSYFFSGGGKTGIARRIAWDEPCLTLTCAPAQNQTERCHPDETRPLTVREYARVQTFPDDWIFSGSMTNQYKQIGNAVPVNLAHAIGLSLFQLCLSLTHQ